MADTESATLLHQREGIDAYLVSAADWEGSKPRLVLGLLSEDGVLLGGAGTDSGETDTLGVEYAAYRTYSLSYLPQVRDDHERLRDRHRSDGSGDDPREPNRDLAALQTFIDVLVVVERAVKYIETDDKNEQNRHYRRVRALCDDPMAVIENVERALGGEPHPTGVLEKLRERVRRTGHQT